jgi:hypothetical protein
MVQPEPPVLPELLTVSEIVALAVSEPEVPVIVTVDVPTVAELLAVNVTTLLPVVGLAPNAAVTPLGKPLAARVTFPVNPPAGVTVTVSVPLAPCLTDKLLAEEESEKLGVVPPVTVIVKTCVLLQAEALV